MDFSPLQSNMFTPITESPKYDFNRIDFSMFSSPPGFKSSPSSPSSIGSKYDFNRIDFSMFSSPPSFKSSSTPPSSILPKYDFKQIDFHLFTPPSFKGSPSLESNILETKKYDFSNLNSSLFSSPLGFKSSPSLESNILEIKPINFDLWKEYESSKEKPLNLGISEYKLPEPINFDLFNNDTYKNWRGKNWSKSFEPTRVYGKNLPQYGKHIQLHVHETPEGFITGANLQNIQTKKKIRLTNYDACMLDLTIGKPFVQKNRGKLGEFLGW